MNNCVREKTVKEYIYDLGRKELCHDYEAEIKRIIAMLDEQEAEKTARHENLVARLRGEIELKDIVIRCMAECVNMRGV